MNAHRRLLAILLVGLVAFSPLFAQKQRLQNIPYIDQRRLHYGFLLGVNFADANFEHEATAAWYADVPDVCPAFSVGLMGDLALSDRFSLRMAPTLYFQSRDVTLRSPSGQPDVHQSIRSTYLEVPLTLKISTVRLNNYRPYMALGVGVWYDWSHEKETPLVYNRWDVGLHVALGSDFYLPFFKFCPEVRFNWGLLDMLDHERAGLKDPTLMPYTEAVSRARNKSVSLVFYFE